MTSVDIVVPCYNYGRFLRGCVRSILSQVGVDLHLLIIDDASSDESRVVGMELAQSDQRVCFLRHEANAGHIETYNEGIDRATAEFWMLISADDILAPGALMRAFEIVGKCEGVGLVGGADVNFSSVEEIETDRPHEVEPQEYEIMSGRDFILRSCQTASNIVSTPTAFVRSSLIKEIGGYRTGLPHTADMELQLQIAARAPVAISRSVQAFKRIHPNSMEMQDYPSELADIKGRKAAFDTFFSSSAHLLGESSAGLQTLARRQLAVDAFWAANRAFERGELQSSSDLAKFSSDLDSHAISFGSRLGFQVKRMLGPSLSRKAIDIAERYRQTG